jgi:hypothetical protein
MATNGIDSATTALVVAAMNGGTAFTVTTPLRCLFHSAMRTTDTGSDTEISTSSGYVAKAGSLFSGTALAFAAATPGAPSTSNSNVAATVTNMPASTWAGNTIVDSKATPRTTGSTGNTTNLSTTVTASDGAFLSSDVGAIISGTNIPSNTVITAINSGTSVTISQAATGTATTTVLTINRLSGQQTTFWATLTSSKTVNAGDTVTVPSGSWQTSLA